ncbi:MAG: hypothetical protein J6B04_06330 [Clostridia bacterium]|nr:hypothetical protein [Clostridia bacterium]
MVLLYIIFITYILAINFYSFTLIKSQRDEATEDGQSRASGDGKIILCALLGGAIGVFSAMFALKYRLKNLLLMVLIPIFIVINVYLFILLFKSGITFFVI